MSKGDIILMLLGSSKHLSFRRQIKRQLIATGFKNRNVIIMEDLIKNEKKIDYGSLDDKFEWIVKNYNPRFFFAIFHKNVKNIDGVIFEIGWLCGKLGSNIISKKLRFLFEDGYNLTRENTPFYIQALFSKILQLPFDESKDYQKCHIQILNFINPCLK